MGYKQEKGNCVGRQNLSGFPNSSLNENTFWPQEGSADAVRKSIKEKNTDIVPKKALKNQVNSPQGKMSVLPEILEEIDPGRAFGPHFDWLRCKFSKFLKLNIIKKRNIRGISYQRKQGENHRFYVKY